MTPFENRSNQSPLIKRAAADMKIRNMSPRTIDTYTYQLARYEDFLKSLGKHPSEAEPDDIREYQLMLIEAKKLLARLEKLLSSNTLKLDGDFAHLLEPEGQQELLRKLKSTPSWLANSWEMKCCKEKHRATEYTE